MTLKKLKTEKYIQLVTPPTLGIDIVGDIISPLQEYAIFKVVPQPSGEHALSVIKGEILSIQAHLRIDRLYTPKGKDLSVGAEFIYVDGTPDKDLDQIRDIIKNAGLEPLVE